MTIPTITGLEDAPYAELHLHTCYSLLEGASSPKELIARAARHGYDALTITDRNNLYGAMVFARACRDAGIRSIIGVELTVAADPDADPEDDPDDVTSGSRHDLTLLAENRQGYANLCRLVSLANGWGLVEHAGVIPAPPSATCGSTPPGSSASPAGAVGSWPGGWSPAIERGRGTCCAAGSTGSDRETCGSSCTTTWSRATSPASGRRCHWPAS
jgi:PHP domain